MKKVLVLFVLLCSYLAAFPFSNELKTQEKTVVKKERVETAEMLVETPTISPTTKPKETEEIVQNTPTPVATEQEKRVDPYLLHETDFSKGKLVFSFENGGLEGKKLQANVVSPKNLGVFANASEAFQVWNGFGIILPDKYNNLLLYVHSGYYGGEPLQGEVLRYHLEGWGNSTQNVEQRLKEIKGTGGSLTFNQKVFRFETLSAIRVRSKDLNPDLDLDSNLLDIPEQAEVIGDLKSFENLKNNHDTNHNKLLITFCGWGPEEIPENQRYTYYRYIVLLKIKTGTSTLEGMRILGLST